VKEHQAKVDYQAIAEGTLERLTQLIQDFAGNPTSDVSRKIFEVCHDLRGEGASFGYPAISRVAELICRVLDCSGQRDRRFLDIVKVEVDSLRALVRFNVKGNPRGTAMELIDALEFLVDAYLGKLKAAA
jgi:chemotaxis protein histidine kinase CheA